MTGSVEDGPDGRPRCPWPGMIDDERYRAYHDDEWGRPVHGDRPLFERLSLEAFQSGLSWRTILHKRTAFRDAFAGFEPARVAAFDEADVARLMGDAGIVRNRRKIEATIANARALDALPNGWLDDLVWSHRPPARPAPATFTDVPSAVPESARLARALKAAGLKFIGPTTMYALMQACGLVDDHLAGCAFRRTA